MQARAHRRDVGAASAGVLTIQPQTSAAGCGIVGMERNRDRHAARREVAPMTAMQERLALGFVLAGALAYATDVAWYRPRTETAETARGGALPSEPPRSAPARSTLPLQQLERRALAGEPGVDVFGARTWFSPPRASPGPPMQAIAPPTQPAPIAAPRLPFRYMGRLFSGDERVLFVAEGDRGLVLREGDVADALYRLDRVGEAGATFTHLQLGVALHLSFLGESGGVAQEQQEAGAEFAAMRGGTRPAIVTGRESDGPEASSTPAGAAGAHLERAPETGGKSASAADARRARAVLALPRDPWACTAQRANQLRDCDAKGESSRSSACKQAAASRYRACLGGSLRSALSASAGDEQ
jgi:hypothetical protein